MAVCESSSYKRYPTKVNDRKSVWHYFLQGVDSAKCNIATCGTVIKCVGVSTKDLHTHRASIHNIDLLRKRKESVADLSVDADVQTTQPGPATKKWRTSYKQDREVTSRCVLSRMTARDLLPFFIFCTSADIREGPRATVFFENPNLPILWEV